MGIHAAWGDNQKTYIIVTFDPEWTIEEFYAVNAEQVPAMVREVSHEVHVVTDFTHTTARHMQNAISHAKSVGVHRPENSGKAIVVSNNAFINSLISIFRGVFKGKVADNVIPVRTMAEAHQVLATLSQNKADGTAAESTV